MAEIEGSVVETPGVSVPPDLANAIAVVGHFADLNSATPQIVRVSRFGDVKTIIGRGKGADLAAFMLREAGDRANPASVFCVPYPATIAGSIVDNGSSGFGPGITATATNTNPFDDATIKVRVSLSGILGVAQFELSTANSVARDLAGGAPTITPLYEPARTIPAATNAYVTGTIDLTGIVYALPSIVVGTIDIVNSTTLYGSSGTLAGSEFDIDPDGVGATTVAFGTGVDAPSSYVDVIATFDDALAGLATASVTSDGTLRLTCVELSTAGSMDLIAGSPDALALLGLTPGLSTGAFVRGEVNMATFNYDSGTALSGLTVIVDENTTTAQTVTFGGSITNSTTLLSALNGGTTNITWSLNGSNFLVATCDTTGISSTIALGAGTAHSAIFGTPSITTPGTSSYPGTAGALDGLTLIYQGDATSGSQTWTIPSGASAYASSAAFITGLTARTGVDALSYSATNYLRVGSSTYGSSSTFQVTGGTGRTALGLPIQSATGSASVYDIDHLGIRLTFAAGTYTANYTRTWTVKAPACSATDLQDAIDALVAQEHKFGRVVCASYVPLDQIGAFIQAAASTIGLLEGANDAQFPRAMIMGPIDEADADVKNAYVSAVGTDVNIGRRVDFAGRSGYFRPARSSPNNTGSLLRSSGWPAAARYASLPLGRDMGQHNIGPVPYCDYVTVHEDAAVTKMGGLRTAEATPRALVLQKWGDGYYFDGGYTLAPRASAYADQHVADGISRVAQLTHAALIQWLNDPKLPLDKLGKLTPSGAGAVSTTVYALLASLLPPPDATSEQRAAALLDTVIVAIDTTIPIGGTSGSQRIIADVSAQFKGIARAVTFRVAAGQVS